MINNIFRYFFLLFTIITFGQETSSSPYSFYGIGDMRFKGTIENRSMGGLSIMTDSIHLNLQNPASYSALKLTTFTVGASYQNAKLHSGSQQEKARRTGLDYLALAWPMGRWGAGFGLMPFTSVGYKIQDRARNFNETGRQFSGTGGLNKVFFGGGYEITKGLHFGADFNFYFGNIETSSIHSIADIQLGTREINTSSASGVGMTAGLSYRRKVNDKLSMYASTTFSPAATISFSNERTIGTVQFLTLGGIRPVDEQSFPVADTKVKVPAKFTLGAGIGEERKWMAGAEVTLNHNSSLTNRFTDIDGAEFKNGVRYNVGGFYLPKFNSFSNYFERITYRAGFYHQQSGLVINNEEINDTGVTFGLGMPVGGVLSNINAGFEYGKRGTTDAGLVKENYFNVTLALSLNDRWFVKRRYD